MKDVIGLDFGGTIIKTDAAEEGHKEWFNVMGYLLKDKKIWKLAEKKDYFPDVLKIMEKYTGLSKEKEFDKMIMTKLARNLYQLTYLGMFNKTKKGSANQQLIIFLKELKKSYSLAIISTTPEDILVPMLEVLNIKGLFDYIYKSPVTREPSKRELLQAFVKNVKKPIFYIGNSEEDVIASKELGIKSVLAKWYSYDKEAESIANFQVSNIKELKKVIEND